MDRRRSAVARLDPWRRGRLPVERRADSYRRVRTGGIPRMAGGSAVGALGGRPPQETPGSGRAGQAGTMDRCGADAVAARAGTAVAQAGQGFRAESRGGRGREMLRRRNGRGGRMGGAGRVLGAICAAVTRVSAVSSWRNWRGRGLRRSYRGFGGRSIRGGAATALAPDVACARLSPRAGAPRPRAAPGARPPASSPRPARRWPGWSMAAAPGSGPAAPGRAR